MRRRALLLFTVILLVPAAGAVTSYDVAVDGDAARINVTFELYSADNDTEINYWRTSWSAPADAEILSVEDSIGPIEEYTFRNGVLRFETNRGPARTREVVTVRMRVPDVVDAEHRAVDRVSLQLPGFDDARPDVPDEVTQVNLTTERRLFSLSHSFGFDSALRDRGAALTGEGPVNVYLAVGEGGERYDHYVLFGDANLSVADDLYWVPAAVTGFLPRVNRWPVIVYPDAEYDREVDRWSAGQYRTGGLIFVRKSELERDRGPAVVLHEVMHGFNEQALRWSSADRAWFDEGTASYIEWLVNAERNVTQAEIFGEEITWIEGNRRYTLPPRKTPEDLIDYHGNDRDYMRSWTLFNESIDRTFGYAFSELVVRRYVQQNGADALRSVYRDLRALNRDLDAQVPSTEESNRKILSIMGTDLRPCAGTEQELRACLDAVHGMDPTVPELGDLENGDGSVDRVEIRPVERPEPSETLPGNGTAVGERTRDVLSRLSRLLAGLVEFLRSLL